VTTPVPSTGQVRGVRVSGVGVHVPPRVLTNQEISEFLDTSDEWIRSRTGIRERRIAADAEAPSDLGAHAARRALAMAGLSPHDIDLVVLSSLIPDMVFPATAAVIAERIGAGQAGAFDVQAGCTGFVYALAAAAGFAGSGMFRRVLVVGAETVSKGLDWDDRSTCVLFGDGAGAVVVEAAPAEPEHVMTFDLGNDGAGAGQLLMPAGGARLPASAETVRDRSHYLKMNGPEVFRFAIRVVAQSCRQVLDRAALRVEDIDLFVPHQANVRIIDSAAKRLGMPAERVFTNLERYGNTSCASIPLCLAEAVESGRLAKGDRLLLVGFGAGLSWGSVVITWDIEAAGQPVSL
jgi:3-oxoacyl-[acyl-carrier-protein] synthase-3